MRFGIWLAVAVGLVLAGPGEAKVFRVNVVADPAQMDPITYSEIVSGRIMRNMYEGFTATADDGTNVPALAVSWEALTGGAGFRFHLRPGVKFHSGRAFGAKDVKYTFEALLRPGGKGGLSAGYLGNVVGAAAFKEGKAPGIEGVRVVDDLTVEVLLTKLDVLFPIYPFFFMDSGVVAEQGEDWMTKVSAGTGPYKFKHVEYGIGRSGCQCGVLAGGRRRWRGLVS